MNKTSLRKHLKQQRSKLTSEQVDLFSKQAAEALFSSQLYDRCEHIACYHAVNNEMSCEKIIHRLFADKKHCYLPAIQDDKMAFFEYKQKDNLTKNQYGILQPVFDSDKIIDIDSLDLILLPLLGFDQGGIRLGMGAGFYDRTLTHHHQSILCGMGYAFQEIEKVPFDDWDVWLDASLTEVCLRVL